MFKQFNKFNATKDFVCVCSMNTISFTPFFTALAQEDISAPVQLIWQKPNVADKGGKKFVHNHENVFLVFFGNRLKLVWNFGR